MRWLGLRLGRGTRGRRPARTVPAVSAARSTPTWSTRLLAAGRAYQCYCTPEELEERREAAARRRPADAATTALPRPHAEQIAAYEAEGREPVIRFRMPDRDDVHRPGPRRDHVRRRERADFVIVRANGQPLYTLVNPVDDALMGITHVLRGEDLLSSTPRQIALYEAFARDRRGDGPMPRFGHLPFVMGDGNRKLSKRDPSILAAALPRAGFLPEGLLNYLALLGWSIGDDRESSPWPRWSTAFDVSRVNPNPARFDPKKAEAINGDVAAPIAAGGACAAGWSLPPAAGVAADVAVGGPARGAARGAPLVQERMSVLTEAAGDARVPVRGRAALLAATTTPSTLPKTPDGTGGVLAARDALGQRARVDDRVDRGRAARSRSSTDWASSRSTPSARSASRSPVAGSHPRCSSRCELLGRDRTLARLDAASSSC